MASIRPLVQEIENLGPLPSDAEAGADGSRADRWEALTSDLEQEGKITDHEAAILARLFPSDESESHGVAWSLLHLG